MAALTPPRLAALMLGRMRMSISEAEEAYINLSKDLFTPTRANYDPRQVYDFLQASGKFKSEPLETHIKKMLHDKKYKEEELLKDTDPEACKVLVIPQNTNRSLKRLTRI
jgi:hypothetical protein